MIDLERCRFVVWGCKSEYQTHTHIHEGFYRTLKGMGKDVQWLDHRDDLAKTDLSDTFFITEHAVALKSMPIRDDCFYAIHGLNNNPELFPRFQDFKHRVSWGVYQDANFRPEYSHVMLAEDTPLFPAARHMDFRWATDQLPSEIERNKPAEILGKESRVIHWVGTVWWPNELFLAQFKRACDENGVEFRALGSGQATKPGFEVKTDHVRDWARPHVVSVEENIRLIRESHLAPAISGTHHVAEGYAPCRVFKNISYGQPGITNNPFVRKLFQGDIIYEPDAYKLFYVARERIASMTVEELHRQMDYVAANHTYVNRINAMLQAAQIIMEMS